MKLPDEKILLVGRVGHGCFWADKPATLSDIRAAAREMGYAVVPVEPTDDMRMDGWVALDDVEGTHKDPAYYCWKAMIKAAEDEQ